MSDLPDWLKQTNADASSAVDSSHLQILRRILGRDYLSRTDWRGALEDVAAMTREALAAERAFVAVVNADGTWSAVTSDGGELSQKGISEYGSLSILEKVRATGKPVLTTSSQPLDVRSESILRQDVQSVLAVPISFWDVSRGRTDRALGGCLYAHRTSSDGPFSDDDVTLVLDIARIVEPNLNLLRHLTRVEADLSSSRRRIEELEGSVAGLYQLGRYGTQSPAMARQVLEPLRRVAHATRVGILILGPTGSGKSFLAQAYHYECPRKNGPFVTMDCSQVTSGETLAAELFGYAPSSGYANSPPGGRHGKAKLAHQGTLFIDEIGSLPLDLQQRLLRLIQAGVYSSLGTSEESKVDIQIIAATSEELGRLVKEQRFREDLYWRLREVTVQVPPLDRRPEDIPALARTFLDAARGRYGRDDPRGLSDTALSALVAHPWSRSGNVRGLEHTMNRAVLMAPPGKRLLDADDVPFDVPEAPDPATLPLRAPVAVAAAGAPAVAPPPVRGRTARSRRPRLDGERREQLAALLAAKIVAHQGVLASMAADPEIVTALGYEQLMPDSTLALWIRDLGLTASLESARRDRRDSLDLETLRAAIVAHGSGSQAAESLGITRDTLVWRLRKEGLSISDVLGRGDG